MSPHTPKKEQVLEKACFQKEPVPFLVMRRMPHQRDEAECNRAVCDELKWRAANVRRSIRNYWCNRKA